MCVGCVRMMVNARNTNASQRYINISMFNENHLVEIH